MGDTALIELRCHDPDIFRKRIGDLDAQVEAFGMDAVVIGDQNAHRRGIFLSKRPPAGSPDEWNDCSLSMGDATPNPVARFASSRPYRIAAHRAPRSSRQGSGSSP